VMRRGSNRVVATKVECTEHSDSDVAPDRQGSSSSSCTTAALPPHRNDGMMTGAPK
jgi:hypothetical protein